MISNLIKILILPAAELPAAIFKRIASFTKLKKAKKPKEFKRYRLIIKY